MRKIFTYIALLTAGILLSAHAEAQTIALGESTPRIKKAKWLNGSQPKATDFTYIEFIHSASTSCRNSAERIHKILKEFDNTSFVLISHQDASEIDLWVTNIIDKKSGVIVDDYKIRNSFGVNYAPYAVILDHKCRALWFGNPQLLDKKSLEELLTK